MPTPTLRIRHQSSALPCYWNHLAPIHLHKVRSSLLRICNTHVHLRRSAFLAKRSVEPQHQFRKQLDRMTDEAQSSSMCARRWCGPDSMRRAAESRHAGRWQSAQRAEKHRQMHRQKQSRCIGSHAIFVCTASRRHKRRPPCAKNRSSGLTYRRAPTGCLPVTRSQASRTAPLICSHADVPRCS